MKKTEKNYKKRFIGCAIATIALVPILSHVSTRIPDYEWMTDPLSIILTVITFAVVGYGSYCLCRIDDDE